VISRQQAIELFDNHDLLGIAMQADDVRKRLHPEGIVTYFIAAENNDSRDTVARVTFRSGETIEQQVNQLQAIREIQEQKDVFKVLVPSFEGTAAEYLKLLAISRIYLPTIPHVQTSCDTDLKLCQIALRFGANDIAPDGPLGHHPSEEQLRCLIRDAGFVPRQRDAGFGTYFLY
jgi:cyclic dehypoxanthinyl futalosine synthase